MKLQKPESKGHGRLPLMVFLAVWGSTLAGGMLWLTDYSNAPAPLETPHSTWPATAGFDRDPAGQTLVIFLHPRCPCSLASVNQLARILTKAPDSLAVCAVYFCPRVESADWVETAMYHTLARWPNVVHVVDYEATEAKRFCVYTSGHVCVYTHKGDLQFSGGITCGRGHEGDNLGYETLASLLKQGAPKHSDRTTPVYLASYGCSLATPPSNAQAGRTATASEAFTNPSLPGQEL